MDNKLPIEYAHALISFSQVFDPKELFPTN